MDVLRIAWLLANAGVEVRHEVGRIGAGPVPASVRNRCSASKATDAMMRLFERRPRALCPKVGQRTGGSDIPTLLDPDILT